MKILFITAEYSTTSCGGSGVYAYELTKALSNHNVDLHVILPGKKHHKEQINNSLALEYLPTFFLPAIRTPTYMFNIQNQINKICEKESVDIIHCNNTVGAWVKTNTPIITTLQHPVGLETDNLLFVQRALNMLDVLSEGQLVRKSHQIITTCAQSQRLFQKQYPNHKNKFLIIPIGIDVSFFKPIQNSKAIVAAKHGLDVQNKLVFVPGGARGKRKGLEYLLESIKKFESQDLKFIISGASREIGWEKELAKYVIESGKTDMLIFIGEMDYQDLPTYYSAADLVVFPSIFEGYGLPSLEALSCGTPVIATNTGEAENIIINGQNGLLIEPKNSTALHDAMLNILNDVALLEKFATNARASVIEKYAWNSLYKRYIHEYENLLS